MIQIITITAVVLFRILPGLVWFLLDRIEKKDWRALVVVVPVVIILITE